MAELDPSISLPLLRGLARSTGYTKQQLDKSTAEEDKNTTTATTNNDVNDGDGNNTNPSSPLKSPTKIASPLHSSSTQQDKDNDKRQQQRQSLPMKLHQLLSTNEITSIAHWMPHGRSFKVCDYSTLSWLLLGAAVTKDDDQQKLEQGGGDVKMNNDGTTTTNEDTTITDEVKLTKILKSYGFHQFTSGLDKGTFYHEDFLRCHYDKCCDSSTLVLKTTAADDEKEKVGDAAGVDDEGKKGLSLSTTSSSSPMEVDEMDNEEEEEEEDEDEVEEEEGGGDEDHHQEDEIMNPSAAAAVGAGGDGGNGDNNSAPTNEESTFMAITACNDVNIARQYLEMSGHQLEMAVSLFMDHNVGGGGGGIAPIGGNDPVAAAASSSSSSAPAASAASAKSKSKKKSKSSRRSKRLAKKKKKKEDEPDFYSMPPMPLIPPSSLSSSNQKKKPIILPAQRIVQSALKEYRAFKIIRHALLCWIRKRRPSRMNELKPLTLCDASSLSDKSIERDFHHGAHHFLFQSLLHPSLPVRRCAARMIMHNLHRDYSDSGGDSTDDGDSDNNKEAMSARRKSKILELQEVLIILLHGVMFDEAPYQIESFEVGNHGSRSAATTAVSTISPPLLLSLGSSLQGQQHQRTKSSQGGGSDPAVQLMAMLISLVCDGGFSNIMVENEIKEMQQEQQKYYGGGVGGAMMMGVLMHNSDEGTILCQSKLRELASDSIESFVASGGLRWACGSIVRLCHLLVHGDGGNNANGNYVAATVRQYGRQSSANSDGDDSHHDQNVERMNELKAQTVQTRLLLLIDLVYKLVLFGTVPAAVDAHGPFTSEDDNSKDTLSERKSALEKAAARRRESRERTARLLAASGDSSRTSGLSALRQSLRSTIASGGMGSPPLSDKRSGSLNDKPGDGDRDPPNINISEENLQRKERRKSSLERVHQIFWSSTLPAAKCIPSFNESEVQNDDAGNLDGQFSPLACLIAAHEILRSTPTCKSALAANGRLRGLEKSIATLARLVDPAAASAVVVSDPDIPWGMKMSHNTLSKKRDRASSHTSQDSHRSASSPSRTTGRAAQPGSRAKRKRTSGNVTSLLERLSQVEAPLANRATGLSATSGAAAIRTSNASHESSSSALFASRYRSAMESMLRGGSNSSPSREGSLSRILGTGGASRLAGAGSRPGSSYSARSSSTAGSPNRVVRARAVASSQLDEWREPDADEGQAMDIDIHDDDDDDDNDDDDNPLNEHGESDGSDSEFEEVVDIADAEDDAVNNNGNNNGDGDDGEGSVEDEDTDEELFEDNGQFDDAVINMEEININASSHREDQLTQSRNNPHRQSVAARSPSRAGAAPSPIEASAQKKDREHAYLQAAMQLLESQYPEASKKGTAFVGGKILRTNRPRSIFAHPIAIISSPLLTDSAEVSLLRSICNIVKPPRKPLNLKIFMRRAPTQEEFFRGSLSRNPISLSSIEAGTSNPQGTGAGDERRSSGPDEPRVSDLRLHIAKDLQMEDSAELLELLVANKILDVHLKLRVVQQVLWKKYVEENATSASSLVAGAGPGHQMISTGSGLSMIFSSSSLAARGRNGAASDDNAILASFPPMVVTYRLAGVDGEATEDKVEVQDLEDPEAPTSQNTPEARERRMEKEFGITRVVTQNRGIPVLLASIQDTISSLLRRIRRDEVARRRQLQHGTLDASADGNLTREAFAKSPPCPGLVLLRHCANLTGNRKKLLANRAPTILLRLLLDILNSMNRSSPGRKRSSTIDFSTGAMDVDSDNISLSGSVASSSRAKGGHTEGNPTTQALQEIIELLASDISAELDDKTNQISVTSSFADLNQLAGQHLGDKEDERTLPLVLKSLHSTELSPPLRKVIAKLLPFLTYGQVSQSKELASYFARYISVDSLGRVEEDSILMNTFVETAINLPPVAVCDNLRTALIQNGFVEKVRLFLMKDAPLQPPPWSPALYPKSTDPPSKTATNDGLKEEWRQYFDRPGIDNAFQILTGLCSRHPSTQLLLSKTSGAENAKEDTALNLLTLCHWMESTSDNTSSGIKNPNGILAETLLDALKECNESTSEKIGSIRKKTRDRKREIAEERRNKALKGMGAFRPMGGSSVAGPRDASADTSSSSDNRPSSMFASMLGMSSSILPSSTQPRTRASSAKSTDVAQPSKPSWMAEMEALDDEKGVTCAVCQEGRTLQPSELLGLYAYMKKVTIASGQGGSTGDIDGTVMLLSLPISLPPSGVSVDAWFRKARLAANALEGTSHALTAMSAANSISSGGGSGRSNHYITTVSAGNAIHCSCHSKAKAADRNHPKAPKSKLVVCWL